MVCNFGPVNTNSAIQILKTFTGKELSSFEDFLNTPFHNKNKKVVQLFDLLKKYHPEYSVRNLTMENLFGNLMGKAKFKETYIRNLFSDLTILAEKFLQYNLITKDPAYERLLIEEMKNRDLYDLAEKKINSFEKKINSNRSKDQDYYQNKNFIYEMKSFLLVDRTLTDSFRNEQISGTIKLFMIILMENSLYLRVEEQRVNIKHSFGFLKHSLQYIGDHLKDFEDSPLLIIYYYIWLCFLNNNDESYFLKAKQYFRDHFGLLAKIDKKNIYSAMQVYYIDKIDGGDSSYNKEFLNFLLEMVRFNVLSHKKKDFINLNLYRNILILCVMQKEIKILKKFISEFINFVSEESRTSILAYSNAHLNYLQKNFEKTLEHCNRINFNDLLISTNDNLYFKNDIKSMILKCLYELSFLETALSNIDAFRHYLRHSKLMKDNTKKRYMNFLSFVNELIRLKMNFNEFNIEKLKQKLDKSTLLIQKHWLNEKINELSQRSV
ncbi:MAG: hypothetical protein ABI462_06955 [Ignavibacteria bacterium]